MAFAISACNDLEFERDITFINSAMANSPEFYIKLNNVDCKDVEGMIGFCAKRIRSDQDITISALPQQYDYQFMLDCTDYINSDIAFIVPKGTLLIHKLPHIKYEDVNLFNCTVDILPEDRSEPIAAFARFQVVVVDNQYTSLPVVMRYDDYIILGKYAYKSLVFEGSKLTNLNEVTTYETTSNKAIVESYNMRYTYYGF